jgi:LysR family glycine cleavage system transcriptional activator
MPRRLPPFNAIRAFEATARHLSMTAAADELCVTPSAISHQIRALEAFLDTALFEREGNRLRLTLTGAAYKGKLTGLLDQLDETTREIARPARRELRVLTTPGFAARWLVPRLDRLAFGHEIRLRISEGAPSTDFATNEADVVVHWGDAPVPGVVVEPMMASARYPVASPDFVARAGIVRPADLLGVTLMHDEVGDGWAEWAEAAGVGPLDGFRGPRFPNCEIATTAAERGQGVALGYEAMVRETVACGRLVRLFDTVTLPRIIYSVAYPEARAGVPRIAAFRDWLFAEVAGDGDLAPSARTAAE